MELGKTKPNKSNLPVATLNLQNFNTMIKKLYEINEEYERVKMARKMGRVMEQEDSDPVDD